MVDKTVNKKTIGIILISCLLLVGIVCGIYFIVKKITSENEPEAPVDNYTEIVAQTEKIINSAQTDEEKAMAYLNGAYDLKENMSETGSDSCEKITEYTEQVKKLSTDENTLKVNESISSSCKSITQKMTINTKIGTNE